MIKANLKSIDGKNHIVLGLTHANLARLQKDGLKGFIEVDLAPFGVPGVIVYITAAETEDTIVRAMGPMINKDTVIHDYRKK